MEHKPLISNNPPFSPDNIQLKSLDPSLCAELSASIKGTLHLRGDSSFENYSKIFNGDVISLSSLIVRPVDTEDVCHIVRFCARHSWSLSVKAGGYGTHGQAVQGDVILDISLLNDIHIEPINAQGGYTSLKDMPSFKNTEKCKQDNGLYTETSLADSASHPIGKRSADDAFGPCEFPRWTNVTHPDVQEGSGTDPAATQDPDNTHPSTRRRIWQASRTIFPSSLGPFNAPPFGTPFPMSGLGGLSSAGASRGDRVRHESSGSNSSGEGASGSVGSSLHGSDSNFSLGSHGGMSVSTSVTSADSPLPIQCAQSDPFGYMACDGAPAGGITLSAAHIPDLPSSSQSPPYAPPVPPSLVMDIFSPAGHYTPTRVVPSAPHAYMTFGAGAKQKDIDLHSASHPLPATSLSGKPCFTPYHVPFSAHPVGSSVMLLGGFGFLSRLHGLSIDNLVEAEMVLADGSIVIVNEEENQELFWTLRGAGPAFGIVTRYKAKAYPVPVVFAGNLIYKFRKSTAASLIKHFRDCVKNVPRELYANVILTAGPDGDALLVIQICYLGAQEQGSEFLQAITSWEGEQCLLNEVSEKSFLNQQEGLAQLIRGKAGRKWFIRSDLLYSLSDEAIHETVMRFADTPVGCTWLFELSGGNVSDEHGGCFPASSRQATWNVTAFHQWELDEDDPRCVTSAEDWIKETLAPASAGGPYPSFFAIHESTERVKRTFGDSWERLCELKHKYDPSGVFNHTFWPLDVHGQPKTTLVPTRTEF